MSPSLNLRIAKYVARATVSFSTQERFWTSVPTLLRQTMCTFTLQISFAEVLEHRLGKVNNRLWDSILVFILAFSPLVPTPTVWSIRTKMMLRILICRRNMEKTCFNGLGHFSDIVQIFANN